MELELTTSSPSVILEGTEAASTLEVTQATIVVEVAQSGPQGPAGSGGGGSDRVEYVVVVVPSPVATAIGGSIAGNTLTAAALSSVPVGEDILLTGQTSSADDGIWTHSGGGSFARGDGLATWLAANQADLVVTVTDIGLGKSRVYQVVYNASTDTRSLEPVAADVSSLQSSLTTLTNRLNRYYPSTPVVPHLHVSKYVTFDPDFPLDGSATHVGGQVIDNGQNITVMSNDSGNGGVWTLSLTGPATRATGFGAMVSADIGNYDHVSFTGTRWAYFQLFRLIGDATTLGMAPVPPATGIIGGRGVSKSYKADLIANSVAGDVFTVLEDDNSTTTVDASVDLTGLGVLCILVLSDLTLRTIDNTGAVVAVEDFTRAEGRWTASGVNGDGVGTTVAITDAGSYSVLTGVTPHAASHQDGGSDELALDASQTTTGVFNVARIGTGTPSAFTFLDGTGAWTDNVPVYVPVKNTSGSQITKGAPVYATGTVGATYVIEVSPADADVAAAMPALGLLESTLAVNATGYAVVTGTLRGVDTNAYTVGQQLYVSTTAGQLTGTKPSGSTTEVQSIGVVTRVNANSGEILVGIGNVVDSPNSGIDGGAITSGTVALERLSTTAAPTATPYTTNDWVPLWTGWGTGTSTTTTGGTATASNNQVRYQPIWIGQTVNVTGLGIDVSTANAGASAVVRLGIYANASGRPGTVVVDAGTASLNTAVGKELTFTSTQLTTGWYWLAIATQGLDTAGSNPAFRAVSQATSLTPRTSVPSNTSSQVAQLSSTGITGAFAATPSVSITTTNVLAMMIWGKFG